MATIASQIQRIQDATNQLRTKGIGLELNVSEGVALNSNHKLDDVAKAFDTITFKKGVEIPVELKVVTDGTTTIGNSFTLDPGFYRGCVIKPYFTQSSVTDMVLNIQTWNDTITSQTGTLVPTTGDSANYNYFDKIVYKVQDGAISASPSTYSNTSVTAIVSTAGWLAKNATKAITVPTATITSKVGSNSATTLSGASTSTKTFTINPNSGSDTVLTINAGIYASERTITVKSLASQMTDANATENDVLDKKIVYSNVNGVFQKVEGKMPNHGGDEDSIERTPVVSLQDLGGNLAIKPALGYYNDYSVITTEIGYNPTRTFNSAGIEDVGGTDNMTKRVYYETIPAGYYPNTITRQVQAVNVMGEMRVNYTTNEAKFDVRLAGWIENDVTVNINAGSAFYEQTDADLAEESHQFVIAPTKDANENPTGYLTQVTVDNSKIYDLLSAI